MVDLVFIKYCNVFVPVGFGLHCFTVADLYMWRYLQLSIGRAFVLYDLNCVVGNILFLAVGGISIAFSKTLVAVRSFIHSLEDSS